MSYAFTVTGPVIRHVDGVKFCTWTVVEAGSGLPARRAPACPRS